MDLRPRMIEEFYAFFYLLLNAANRIFLGPMVEEKQPFNCNQERYIYYFNNSLIFEKAKNVHKIYLFQNWHFT